MADTNENFETLMKEMGTVEPKPEKTISDESSNEQEYSYPHLEIMNEERLLRDDLPSDIRKMVITFERKLRMAKRKSTSEATFLGIQKLSALIADKIMDYLEKDIAKEAAIQETGGEVEGEKAEAVSTPEGENEEEGEKSEEEGEESEEEGEESEEEGEESEAKEKEGIFGGILGGILDW